MEFQKIKHIFFDLDHTLWDFDKNSALAFEIIFKRNIIDVDLSLFLQTYAPINLNYWRLYRNNEISKKDLRHNRLKETFDFLKFKIEKNTIDILADEYIKFLPSNNHLLDGTNEILEYLYQKYTLHIITNGFEEVQKRKLENSGIARFFTTVTTSESVGFKKPHVAIFNHAFLNSKATAENSIMIGDSVEADILGAHQIGMKAIHFNYYGSQCEHVPCTSVPHLSLLSQYL